MVLSRTYTTWRHFFGAEFCWQSGASELMVYPRALNDWNAYYDREALRFCYKPDESTGQTLYSCESSDIVAHECGHAVLDAHQPEYWDSLYPETVALHEAFGDISALLVTLVDPSIRAAVLAENKGDLSKSNLVTRLAEQFARGLHASGKADSVVSKHALRDLANTFRYRQSEDLPAKAPATSLSAESHSYSRVFSGAFYDLLVAIFERMRDADPGVTPDIALSRACSTVGHLLAQAIIMAPQGDVQFKTIAAAIFNADAQNFGGKHYSILRRVFVGRRILKSSEAAALRWDEGLRYTSTSALGGAASSTIPVTEQLKIGRAGAKGDLPSALRDFLRLPNQEYRLSGERRKRDTARVLHYVAPREVRFEDENLGPARGVFITLMNAIAVLVDPNGRVLSVLQHKSDRAHEAHIREHLERIVGLGRLYEAPQGGKADTNLLIERGQPYYVAYDKYGNKHVRRAFIQCTL